MNVKDIRKALKQLTSAQGRNELLLARAQRRYLANRKRAYRANAQKQAAQKVADSLRIAGHLVKANRKTRKAYRLGHVAYKNHQRAQHFLGTVKMLNERIEKAKGREVELKAELHKLNHVTIKGDHAYGGSDRERLKKVALRSASNCASGKRENFYSQSGSFDAEHCITGPAYGHRDDCSSWFASVYKSAGLPDPSGQEFKAGYTGTLGERGVRTTNPKPGDAVLYGSFPHHHVEMVVGDNETIGHGSAPVDRGTFDLFGDGNYIFRSYV